MFFIMISTNKNCVYEISYTQCMKRQLVLNFLYKVPLITLVKTTNTKVGRKYAKNQRLL